MARQSAAFKSWLGSAGLKGRAGSQVHHARQRPLLTFGAGFFVLLSYTQLLQARKAVCEAKEEAFLSILHGGAYNRLLCAQRGAQSGPPIPEGPSTSPLAQARAADRRLGGPGPLCERGVRKSCSRARPGTLCALDEAPCDAGDFGARGLAVRRPKDVELSPAISQPSPPTFVPVLPSPAMLQHAATF